MAALSGLQAGASIAELHSSAAAALLWHRFLAHNSRFDDMSSPSQKYKMESWFSQAVRWLRLDRVALALSRKLLSAVVRITVQPEEIEVAARAGQPVCYVLETNSLSNLLALDLVCRQHGLPIPTDPMSAPLNERRAVVMLRKAPSLFSPRTVLSPRLRRLVHGLHTRNAQESLSTRVVAYASHEPRTLTGTEVAEHEPSAGGADPGNVVELPTGRLGAEAGAAAGALAGHAQAAVAAAQVIPLSAPREDVQLVPVSVFWGRSPDKEKSWFKLLFAEDWTVAGRLKRLLSILIHGRNTLVQFSSPLSLQAYAAEDLGAARTHRKIHRVLRVHFRQLRVSVIGPDLSHRRTLVSRLVRSSEVRKAVRRETRDNNITRRKALLKARHYAGEIAADYSAGLVRVLERFLHWWWYQRYEGIEISHLAQLKEVTEGNEVIYVPCHRSHIDYLLLSYVLYRSGLVVPHIAAGINLNLPVIGPILRRGGAFFLRRSFRGNPLYSAVFHEYLATNMERGVPLEYFIEGTRSRTGRLLAPKGGMLSMTVRGYLRHHKRPVVFVPVYVGYEHLFEGRAYVGELSGKSKKKESVFDLVKAVRTLRGKYGRVYVNFGEPLFLEPVLDRHSSDWRTSSIGDSDRPRWLTSAVNDLARDVMTRINSAAAVNPVNLLALALLSTPKRAMLEKDLQSILDMYADLLRQAPYSPLVTVTEQSGSEIVAYGEASGLLQRQAHPLGDVIWLKDEDAVLQTYMRNNVLHLFALPSIIACCFLNNREMSLSKLAQLGRMVYPFIRSELFLRWNDEELVQALHSSVDVLMSRGLLLRGGSAGQVLRPPTGSAEAVQLSVLAQGTLQTLERFYMTISLLFKHGSGTISQSELEGQCQFMAQRIALLHGLNSPEFFAKPLFRNFIQLLKQQGVLSVDEEGHLVFDERLREVDQDAKLVLSQQMRHSVLQVTHV